MIVLVRTLNWQMSSFRISFWCYRILIIHPCNFTLVREHPLMWNTMWVFLSWRKSWALLEYNMPDRLEAKGDDHSGSRSWSTSGCWNCDCSGSDSVLLLSPSACQHGEQSGFSTSFRNRYLQLYQLHVKSFLHFNGTVSLILTLSWRLSRNYTSTWGNR